MRFNLNDFDASWHRSNVFRAFCFLGAAICREITLRSIREKWDEIYVCDHTACRELSRFPGGAAGRSAN